MEWRRWIYAIPARLTAVFRTRRVEQDLDDELAFHVAMQTPANSRDGVTEAEAHRRARLEIGGVEQVKERSRDVRTAAQPDAIASRLAHEVAAINRDLPVHSLMTARTAEERSTASLRLLSNVLGAFAGLGLVLAGLGIFGVVSYSTTQRAGEIGMRIALGARQSAVLWLVLKQGITLTIVGTMVGLGGGLGSRDCWHRCCPICRPRKWCSRSAHPRS